MGWRETTGTRLGPRPWVWQLLFFMLACVTVLIAFQAFRPSGTAAKTTPSEDDALATTPTPVLGDSLADDEFRAPPPLTGSPGPRNPPRPDRQQAARFDLTAVRDSTLGVRFDESDAFFDLLHETARMAPDELEAQVRYDVQYVNLMTDPTRYRGQAITVAGELQRLVPFKAVRNDHGLQTLYEAWIVTPDSAPHAYRVVTSQLGEGVPLSKPGRLPVVATGYFLKQEGYAASTGVEIAPVVVGAALDRDDTVFHPAGMATFPPWMLGLIVAGGLILTATIVSMAVTERRSARLRPLATSLSVETLTKLTATPAFSVHTFLRDLEETDRARQFETVRPSTATSTIKPPHVPMTKPRASRGVDMPTPTPPTRQFRRGWKRSWTEDRSAPEANDPS